MPTPDRRWFRWSLRTLFVVVTVIGLWLGYSVIGCYASPPTNTPVSGGEYEQFDLSAIAISSDGKSFATSGREGTRLSDATSLKTLATLDLHKVYNLFGPGTRMGVTGLAFMPNDAARLLSCGLDGNIICSDSRTGKTQWTISEPWIYSRTGFSTNQLISLQRVPISAIAVSPDGLTIAANVMDRICLWDTHSRKLVAQLGRAVPTERQAVKDFVSIDNVRNELVTKEWLHFGDPAPQELIRWKTGSIPFRARVAFTPDGSLLGTTNQRDDNIVLWDVRTKKEHLRIPDASDFAFSKDGKQIATCSTTGRTEVRDIATKSGTTLSDLESTYLALPSPHTLISGRSTNFSGRSSNLELLDLQSGETLWKHSGPVSNEISGFAFSNNILIVSWKAGDRHRVEVWRWQ